MNNHLKKYHITMPKGYSIVLLNDLLRPIKLSESKTIKDRFYDKNFFRGKNKNK